MSSSEPLLNVATFNLRYDTPHDGINAWPNRREWVRDLIDYHAFDIVGVQEALSHQLEYLTEGRFAFVGVGREDGIRSGEHAAILYDRERFAVEESGTFWLSETPEKPGLGWDADCTRVCTWAALQDIRSERTFHHFNTHFDHRGEVARERSAELILERIETIAGKGPFFLTGDFNLTPEEKPILRLASALSDSRAITEQKPYGPSGTFSGFDVNAPLETIDYIFVGKRVRVHKYAVLPDNWNRRYPSDHLPVVIQAELLP